MGKVPVLLTAALLSGCATIVEGTDQTINVQLSPDTATCQISQKGSLIATVGNGGDQVLIPKSRKDLLFSCSADGYQKQNLTIESSASGWGVLGCFLIDLCITDYSTGALNKYPKSLSIALQRIGQNVVPGQEQAAPAAVAAPPTLSEKMPPAAVAAPPTLSEKMPPAAPMIESPTQVNYGVHFASYEKANLAQRGWSEIWRKHWQKLSGVIPYIEYRSSEGGQLQYKLYGTGLTKEKAKSLCQSLQEHNEYCAVVNF